MIKNDKNHLLTLTVMQGPESVEADISRLHYLGTPLCTADPLQYQIKKENRATVTVLIASRSSSHIPTNFVQPTYVLISISKVSTASCLNSTNFE